MTLPQAKIVLVEDDVDLASSWMDLFELSGYESVSYEKGLRALSHPEVLRECNILISDYYLPDINGIELIQRARQVNPALSCLLLTGSRDKSIAESAAKVLDCGLIYKPANIDAVEAYITATLAQLSDKGPRAG